MTWLLEDPLPILLLGGALTAVLAGVYYNSRRGSALAATIGAAALTAGFLVVERLVVTEREEIEAVIYGAAEAVTANDLEAVMELLDPRAEALRNYARTILSRAKIRHAKVGNLAIVINSLTSPPTATVTGIARVEVDDSRGTLTHQTFVQPFTVRLVHRENRWYVMAYEEIRRNR